MYFGTKSAVDIGHGQIGGMDTGDKPSVGRVYLSGGSPVLCKGIFYDRYFGVEMMVGDVEFGNTEGHEVMIFPFADMEVGKLAIAGQQAE